MERWESILAPGPVATVVCIPDKNMRFLGNNRLLVLDAIRGQNEVMCRSKLAVSILD